MRIATTLALTLVLPASLAGQSPTSRGTRDAVMVEFETFADLFASRLVAAFDSIPASRYGFAPTPTQQTVGYIAQHLEAANNNLCGRFSDLRHSGTKEDSAPDSVKARWPKDTLVARLDASLRFCDSALARTPHVNSAELANYLLSFETDLAEHYSQISSYMRMLGMVPPSALPSKAHVAIELPNSVLAQYVGTYEIAEGIQLEVALHDGALSIVSKLGGAPAPLLPERDGGFFVNGIDAQVTFARDNGGTVRGLVVHRYGRDRAATKVR